MITEVESHGQHVRDEWERGYSDGYDRALSHMVLMGCRCQGPWTCAVCQTVNLLRKEVGNAS